MIGFVCDRSWLIISVLLQLFKKEIDKITPLFFGYNDVMDYDYLDTLTLKDKTLEYGNKGVVKLPGFPPTF